MDQYGFIITASFDSESFGGDGFVELTRLPLVIRITSDKKQIRVSFREISDTEYLFSIDLIWEDLENSPRDTGVFDEEYIMFLRKNIA